MDLLLDEAEQLDPAGGAYIKGSRSEPTQPQLPEMRRVLGAAARTVVLTDSCNVSAGASVWAGGGGIGGLLLSGCCYSRCGASCGASRELLGRGFELTPTTTAACAVCAGGGAPAQQPTRVY